MLINKTNFPEMKIGEPRVIKSNAYNNIMMKLTQFITA